ncbi:MAG TPA: hypothetical protein VHX36_02450 [Candidatus Acidoferrales bacterium]|jgi:hypothetical protein|nr:hypothetical protein [Candidatus Acidoferrales bacterium]
MRVFSIFAGTATRFAAAPGRAVATAALLCTLSLFAPSPLIAQQSPADEQPAGPVAALVAALSAACRANETEFANYLTAANAAAFHALGPDQRSAFVKRFSLSDDAGRPLISADMQGHTIFRCMTDQQTAEFRFGVAQTRENLSFIPVTVVNAEQTQFGLVRENGGWRLLSLGLVLLDIPQLSKEWAESDLTAREDAAITTLQSLAEAIRTYHDAYGKLPVSLAELGPAPKGGISDEQASLVDAKLATGSVGGYRFQYRVAGPAVAPAVASDAEGQAARSDPTTFELAATPENYGKSGRRSFLLDADGKLHGADKNGAMATADDPVVTQSAQE